MKKIAIIKCESHEEAKKRRKRIADIFAKHSVEENIIYAHYKYSSEAFEEEEMAKKICLEKQNEEGDASPMRWEYFVIKDVVENKFYVCGNYININCITTNCI